MGGRGFKDFRLFNQALLARQAWRLLSKPESLCAQVLKAKYYANGRLEDTVFTGNASSTWQAIVYGLMLLKKDLVWRIGDGSKVRIWRDPWLPRGPSYRPISQRQNCRLHRVSELRMENGAWNMNLLRQHFMQADIEEITKIKTSSRCPGDVLAWAVEPNGVFSVQSAYRLALDEQIRTSMCTTSRAPDG